MVLKALSIQQMNHEIIYFYGWWQLSVCLFAFIALLAIWWHIGKKQNDFGQVWLALSVLCWSISGAFEIYFIESNATSAFIINGWRSIWSLLNSLFILLSLPWFRYLPTPIGHIIKSKYWIYIVGIPFLFSLLPTLSRMISGTVISVINELDVYYAFFTLIFLGFVLWESFLKRRLKALAFLSFVCILVVLVAQIYKLSGNNINLTLFSAIFKTSLIMIFFALALSWVKELAENVIPNSSDLYLSFQKNKLSSGKTENLILLKGFPGSEKRKVKLSPVLFDLFTKFAERRLSNEDWLEIKPKNFSMPSKTFDIKDYNEVKRLLISLLDGVFGKDNWTTEHHLNPLKTTLFEMSEKRDRKIRLKIPKENISL
ncbi:hypothetical protein SAMN04489761_2908 [Tenacibaculum sp. MAR_2009_124]|uniref:hypothetical protein n=1 Tax=Tenacibaculum sp. MAR_2009_124 TaxID=1250059 RepID=UPI00089D3863|nr:hypothetical protein [Tenacibaculum sp. MAR_2009_124]SEC40726.1 hypothetical protein SAMN04489761_2908 [Tenacibaculum sp. MAR_2009_124]